MVIMKSKNIINTKFTAQMLLLIAPCSLLPAHTLATLWKGEYASNVAYGPPLFQAHTSML
jgi:hypothetical protein